MPAASISARLQQAFGALGMGLVGNAVLPLPIYWPDVHMRTESYFHRQDVSAVVAGQSVNFFNANISDYVTNLPQAGYLPGEHAMWLQSLQFLISPQYNTAGGAEVDGEPFQSDADPSTVLADIQALLLHGIVEMKIGNTIVAKRQGLYHFPAGGGVAGFAAITNSTATTLNHLTIGGNGTPDQRNKYQFTPPHPIYPNDQISLSVRWPFARTLKDTYAVTAFIEGGVCSMR